MHREISFIKTVLMQWEGDQENSKRPQLTCRIWLDLPHLANLCSAFRGYLKGHLLQEALQACFLPFETAQSPAVSLCQEWQEMWVLSSSVFPSLILDFYSFYSFILPFTCPSICLSHLPICPSTHPSTHVTIQPFIHPRIYLCIHQSLIYLPNHHPSVIHPSLSSVHPCILPSIHPQCTEGLSLQAAL